MAAPARHPTLLGTTPDPHRPHTSALGDPFNIMAPDAHLGEREAGEGTLPGTEHSVPAQAGGQKTKLLLYDTAAPCS